MDNQYQEGGEDENYLEGEACQYPKEGEDEDCKEGEGCQIDQKEIEVVYPTDYQRAIAYMENIASNEGERKGKQLVHNPDFKRGSTRIAMRCRNAECLFRIMVRRNRKSSLYCIDDAFTDARHFSLNSHGLEIPCINRAKASVVRVFII
jgi:hypothetical protein